ncbi:MAG TPA: hypothetical protein VFE63_15545 [Roseiarcus sp.]|jgi:hypothetical protein|nr:hypothetical protein [Roseiarcus sp.]
MQRKTLLVSIAFRALLIACGAFAADAARADGGQQPFAPQFIVSSTIPANGDLNPYGVAIVPEGFPSGGKIATGDVLVSNFNNSSNLQGTGVTIIKLRPTGAVAPSVSPGQSGNATTYFTSNLNGVTTALGILQRGFVLVGNLPSTDGTFKTHGPGALQVVDSKGNLVTTFTDPKFLGSPWDLTINDGGAHAQLFVSNVVKGTVARLDLAVGSGGVSILSKNEIADGYAHHGNPVAFVLGPTGLAYDKYADVLYVASTLDNAIYAVPAAGTRTSPPPGGKGNLVFSDPHLRGPLALAFTAIGNLVTTNGDAVNPDPTHPSEIVEFTKAGKFVSESNVDASQGGAFGIAIQPFPFKFAAVDDVPNTITVFTIPSPFGGASAQIAVRPAGK